MRKLNILGKTPYIVIINGIITIISIILSKTIFSSYINTLMMPIYLFIATICIVFSCLSFCSLIFDKRIIEARKKDQLITFGVYSYVRNPLNTSYLLLFTCFILLQCNITILINIFVLYLIQDIALIKEENENQEKYGLCYIEYKRKVNKNMLRIQKIF